MVRPDPVFGYRELSGSDQFDRDAAKILEETARSVSR